MRLIDADALIEQMEADAEQMEEPLAKMFTYAAINDVKHAPTVEAPDINVGNIDTTTHGPIPVKNGRNDEDRTTDDYISRRQAIDALKEKVFHNLSDEFYGAMQVLDELPSTQPETNCSEIPNNWIPCSVQLPKESRKYLVTVFDGIGKKTTSAPYHRRSKSWTLTGRMAYWKVIAWMPLPEPYQEGEQE